MNWRWLISRTVRRAAELRKQVWFILNSQRDLLSERAREEVQAALGRFDDAMAAARGGRPAVQEAMAALERSGSQWLQPYPSAGTRENIKEFLVSGVLILSLFSFFIQPMKIPSGSAQPTLYGNVVTDVTGEPEVTFPGRVGRFIDWFRGVDYHRWVAADDGVLAVGPVVTSLGFVKTQRFGVGTDTYTFFWPPDNLPQHVRAKAGQRYQKGDTVFRLRISSGDRLFVDRMTYNFRRPERGETIVFHTVGIDPKLRVFRGPAVLVPDTHYIKRLVAMGGEHVRIGDDRQLVIDGKRLDRTSPGFERVYDFQGPPRDSVYSGHVNNRVALEAVGRGFAPLFPDGQAEFVVRPDHYLVFGDNTMNSWDGRGWGDFPREHVVGKARFVFWPFTSRWGLIAR